MSTIGEDIRTNVDIVDIVSKYVSLKRSGTNYVGLSPFRNEKSPSFVVSPQKQIFKDFGGDHSGDVITFVMEIENIDFMDAVRILAPSAGIDLADYANIRIDKKKEADKEQGKNINRSAMLFFVDAFADNATVQEYVYQKRKLPQAIVKKFGLGYAPNSSYTLLRHLQSKGYKTAEIIQAGLAKTGHNNEPFAFFRDRLMFPIRDKMGNVIGFGGRAVAPDAKPKYLNTPDTDLYDKSKVLYGINFLKAGIRKHDFVVVVEGYMDVIAMSRLGYDNAVAPCGTSLTAQHLKQLSRYTEHIYLLFDMDSAGFGATVRSLALAYKQDCYPKILSLPDGDKDLDDYVNEMATKAQEEATDGSPGDAIIEQLLATATDGFDVVTTRLMQIYDISSVIDKKKLLNELFVLIVAMQSVSLQQHYLDILAQRIGMSYEVLAAQYRQYTKTHSRTIRREQARNSTKTAKQQPDTLTLLAALLHRNFLQIFAQDPRIATLQEILSPLIAAQPADTLLRQVNTDQLNTESAQALDALQLRWENEIQRLASTDEQVAYIIKRTLPTINTLLQQARKTGQLSAAQFGELLGVRKMLVNEKS